MNGDLLPYANHRPGYARGQVEEVWRLSHAENLKMIKDLDLPLREPKANELWVEIRSKESGPDITDLGSEGKWRLIEWNPGEPRNGLWDMGHIPTEKYATALDNYLRYEKDPEAFARWFKTAHNYRAEDPGLNRSHIAENTLEEDW